MAVQRVHQILSRSRGNRVALLTVAATIAAIVALIGLQSPAAEAAPAAPTFTTATPTFTPTPTGTPTGPLVYPTCTLTVEANQPVHVVGAEVQFVLQPSCECPSYAGNDCRYAIYEVSSIEATGLDLPATPIGPGPGTLISTTAVTPGTHTVTFNLYGEIYAGFWNWSYLSGSTTIEIIEAPGVTEQADLDAARAEWEAAVALAGENYSMDYRIVCFCPRTPLISAIFLDGNAFTYTASDGQPVDEFQQYSIASMFDLIQEAIDQDAASINVTYGEFGTPENIQIDYDTGIADEEISIFVTDFAFENDPSYYVELQENLNLALENWDAAVEENGNTYTMTYRVSCFCPPQGDVTATVVDGVSTWTNTGSEEIFSEYTVEDLFEIIQGGIDNHYRSVNVTYNEFGVPVSISTDVAQFLADDGLGITVSEFAFGDAGPTPEQQLAEAQLRWDEALTGPGQNYSMSYRQLCFCTTETREQQTVWVHRGNLELRKGADGTTNSDRAPEHTVESLFKLIAGALANDADRVEVTYDPELGHPTSIFIDRSVQIADEEITINIDAFQWQDPFARALYDARIHVENTEAPGDRFSITYTRSCTIPELCAPSEATPGVVQVDLEESPQLPPPDYLEVAGFLPATTNQPVMTFHDAATEWAAALDYAAGVKAQTGDFVELDIDYASAGELIFWRNYTLEIFPEESEVQQLSYTLDEIGAFGCCTASSGPTIVYEESFEGGLAGWTTESSARTGDFSVGTPEQTYSRFDGMIIQPAGATDGDNALATDPVAGFSVGARDIDGGEVAATSPTILLPDSDDIEISVDWYWGHGGRWDQNDVFGLSVSAIDGGSIPTIVLVDLVDTSDRPGEWATATADLSRLAGRNVVIEVVASDVGAGSLAEAGIDNVIITADDGNTGGGPSVHWSEDFEDGAGFTTGGNALTGQWEAKSPEPTAWRGQALQQGAASSGQIALVTGPLAGASAGTYDVDGGEVTARINDISIPVTFAPAEFVLNFDWYFTHLANATNGDYLTVEVVAENPDPRILAPVQSVLALDERGTTTYRGNQWRTASVDVTQFQGQTISILITASDDPARGALIEAGIDNMEITMETILPETATR